MNFPWSISKALPSLLISLIFLLVSQQASSEPTPQEVNQELLKLYHSLPANLNSDMSARLDTISALFLGKPYILTSLGEGHANRFDQVTLYRLDGFDCETYVTSVLALALAQSPEGYKQCLRRLRYKNAQVSFINRNHFTSLDWNIGNQQQGYVQDITANFKDENKQPVAQMASALIDKPSWYAHLPLSRIRLIPDNPEEQAKRLKELQRLGAKLPKTQANILYIPLTALFDNEGKANQTLFKQIPDASIIEIIRPNWDLQKQIGTRLNVSHLGFAFWQNGQLIFREASSEYGKVVDVPLIDYLRDALSSPTIKGINVQIVLPKEPLADDCLVK